MEGEEGRREGWGESVVEQAFVGRRSTTVTEKSRRRE